MVANGMEGVPWMVGGGAKHSANVGRVLAFMAAGGAGGVAAPGDLKVSPSSTPDNKVHVGVGALSLVNHESNARNEAYIARAIAVTDVTIAPTGAAARSDLIVARIRDPQYSYAAPTDLANGPYAFIEVVPGVPANTVRADQIASLLNTAVYGVARIDVPANQSNPAVIGGWIRDIRKLATPHYEPFNSLQQGPAAAEQVKTTDTAWKNWPSNSTSVDIPPWATRADIEITVTFLTNADALMNTRVQLGSLLGPAVPFDVNMTARPDGDAVVNTQITQASFDVTSIAGTTQTLRLNAIRVGAVGNIEVDVKQQVKFRAEFFERPI